MGQCDALWQPHKDTSVRYYCVLHLCHRGPHKDDAGRTFTEQQNERKPVTPPKFNQDKP